MIFHTVCEPLSKEAYARSAKGKVTVDAIDKKVNTLRKKVDIYLKKANPESAAWGAMLADVEKVRSQVAVALLDADPEAAMPLKTYYAVVERMKDRVENNLEPDAARRMRKQIRDDLLVQVETIIETYLDTATFARVRKQLRERVV